MVSWFSKGPMNLRNYFIFMTLMFFPMLLISLAALALGAHWDEKLKGLQWLKAWRYALMFLLGWGLVGIVVSIEAYRYKGKPISFEAWIYSVIIATVWVLIELTKAVYGRLKGYFAAWT
jgi:hypothetical protein